MRYNVGHGCWFLNWKWSSDRLGKGKQTGKTKDTTEVNASGDKSLKKVHNRQDIWKNGWVLDKEK